MGALSSRLRWYRWHLSPLRWFDLFARLDEPAQPKPLLRAPRRRRRF